MMTGEKRFQVTPLTKSAFDEVAGGVGGAYQRVVRLIEEEVLSNDEFAFWTEATWTLVEAAKKLDALAKRADLVEECS